MTDHAQIDGVVDEFLDIKNRGFEMRSNFPGLDKLSYGFRRGRIYIVGGSPGSGKTSFALWLAQDVALKQDKKVFFFSLEMAIGDMVGRLTSVLHKVPHYKIQQPWFMSTEDFIAIDSTCSTLKNSKLRILCDHMGIGKILAMIEKEKPDFVVIDHLQYLPLVNKDSESKTHELITECVKHLRESCKKHNYSMLLLSQKKRSMVPGKSSLTDFSGSAGIEQQADLAIMIDRPDHEKALTQPRGWFELNVVKNRNGNTGKIEMIFDSEFLHYREKSKQSETPPPMGDYNEPTEPESII